jgi:hypothetical protein
MKDSTQVPVTQTEELTQRRVQEPIKDPGKHFFGVNILTFFSWNIVRQEVYHVSEDKSMLVSILNLV